MTDPEPVPLAASLREKIRLWRREYGVFGSLSGQTLVEMDAMGSPDREAAVPGSAPQEQIDALKQEVRQLTEERDDTAIRLMIVNEKLERAASLLPGSARLQRDTACADCGHRFDRHITEPDIEINYLTCADCEHCNGFVFGSARQPQQNSQFLTADDSDNPIKALNTHGQTGTCLEHGLQLSSGKGHAGISPSASGQSDQEAERSAVRMSPSPSAARPPETPEARCRDCGMPYQDFPLDVVLPRGQWLDINPDDHGLLCAACIVKRAAKVPGCTVVHAILEITPLKESPHDFNADESIKTAGAPVSPARQDDQELDKACQHGVAWDVHCCGCHAGFIFDIHKCVCVPAVSPATQRADWIERLAEDLHALNPDYHDWENEAAAIIRAAVSPARQSENTQ